MTDEKLLSTAQHLTFIDTAGSGFNEEHGQDGASLKMTENFGSLIKSSKQKI
ncbi:MAG: hypothetical protein IPN43_15990 [Chitinophagaceae bacterium]|nr:hypothetical protein [Chitinophagaceae bacterium]